MHPAASHGKTRCDVYSIRFPWRLSPLQNLETLDAAKLTPLSPEVISRQATINIGERGKALV